jgi:hypothetical protein
MGASAWTLDQRMAFANDEALNLLAVAKAANASKSDHGPATWTPSNVSYRCQYAIRWISVVSSYGLAVTDGDRSALRDAQRMCSLNWHASSSAAAAAADSRLPPSR